MARVVVVISDTDEPGRDVDVNVSYDPPRAVPSAPRHQTPAEKIGAALERQWSATRPRPVSRATRAKAKRKPPARRPAVRTRKR